MEIFKVISSKIKKMPLIITVILIIASILNSIVPAFITNKALLDINAVKLDYIFDNVELSNGKISSSIDFENENFIYFKENEKNIKETTYINIKEKETTMSFNKKQETIEYTSETSKEELETKLKDIYVSYYLISGITIFLGYLLKISLIYVFVMALTQYLTKRRIKAIHIIKFLAVSSITSSIISFILWNITKIDVFKLDFINLILISITYSLLIIKDMKKCITSDYTGEGMDSDDIY